MVSAAVMTRWATPARLKGQNQATIHASLTKPSQTYVDMFLGISCHGIVQ